MMAAVALLLALVGAVANAKAAVVEVKTPLAVGDRFAYDVRREREREEDGNRVLRIVSTTPVAAEVTERLADGWGVVWTYGTTAVEDGGQEIELAERLLSSILDGLRLEFVTDGSGMPVAIRNDADVRRHFRYFSARYVNTLVDEARGKGGGLAEIAQVRRAARNRAAVYLRLRDDQLQELVLSDAAMLHRIAGRAYSDEQATELAVETIDVASGEPVRRTDRIRLRQLDSGSGIAIVEWSRHPGEGGDEGAEPETAWTALYTVAVASGRVESVNAEQTITRGRLRIVERTILTRSRAAAPSP